MSAVLTLKFKIHKFMKPILGALLIGILVVPAEARKILPPGKAERKREKVEEKQEQKEKRERDRKHDAVDAFLETWDTDHDGSLTRDEYLVGEPDKAAGGKKFDQANKNGDRYLMRSEIEELLGL